MSVRVSLIIPVYNAASYLKRCLDSALCQTKSFQEIVVIDDGSHDRSGEIIADYCKAYPGVLKSKRIDNSGASRARMTGLDMATGDYVMFLDADDSIAPDYLESYLSQTERGVGFYATSTKNGMVSGQEYANLLLNETRYWGLVRKLYSTSIFRKYGSKLLDVPRHLNIGEDVIANIRIALLQKKIKKISYDGYIDGGNAKSTTRSRDWSLEYERELLAAIRNELGEYVDEKAFWLRELRAYRSLVLHSRESKHKLNAYRKELHAKRPSGMRLCLSDAVFAHCGNLGLLKLLYGGIKSIKRR